MTDPKMHAQGVSSLTNMRVLQTDSNFLFLQTFSICAKRHLDLN